MKPTVRRMDFHDLDEVLKIEERVFKDPWTRRSYEFEIFVNKFSLPVVLELNNRIIGYAVVWLLFEEFHIANLAIRPEFQGKGYGKFLLEELLKMAGDSEYALLEVRPSNRKAIELYKKFGFEEISRRKRYYLNGEDAIVMRKMLKKNIASSVNQKSSEE